MAMHSRDVAAVLLATLATRGAAFHAPAARPRSAGRARPTMSESPLDALQAMNPFAAKADGEDAAAADGEEDDGKMTLEKVASFGVAGVLSIALAETVFWVLSFPTSEVLYYLSTGEWIDLWSQEGQIKFLAFTAGWGAVGGVIAQYRTVLTAAAITPWMDRTVVKPYVNPLLEKFGKGEPAE